MSNIFFFCFFFFFFFFFSLCREVGAEGWGRMGEGMGEGVVVKKNEVFF